jgi:hypothetical protein
MRKIALIVLLMPALLLAGSKEWTTGNGNFAAYVKANYDFNFAKETSKSTASLSPELGAKLFGRNAPVLNGELLLGNYGSYQFNNNIPSADVNKMKDWNVYAGLDLFGVTIWSKTRNIGSVEEDLVGVNKWLKKELPPLRYPLGPVTLDVNFGLTTSTSAKPKVKPDGIKGLTAEFLPTVSADGFVQGAVNAWVLRGGIGATLKIFSGSAGPKLVLSLQNKAVELLGSLKVSLLNGRVFGFVDRKSVKCCFKTSWKRILDVTIFSWNGLSYSKDYSIWSKQF